MKFTMPKKGEIESMDAEMAMEEPMAEEMPVEESPASPDLSSFDDQVLLEELKKRGYEVEM
jgi:hypothetical protein